MTCGHSSLIAGAGGALDVKCFSWSDLFVILSCDHSPGGCDANGRQRCRCRDRSDEAAPGQSIHGATQNILWFHSSFSLFVGSLQSQENNAFVPRTHDGEALAKRTGEKSTTPATARASESQGAAVRWVRGEGEVGREPVTMRIWEFLPNLTGIDDFFVICPILSMQGITQ
jgi:hypothetical protein